MHPALRKGSLFLQNTSIFHFYKTPELSTFYKKNSPPPISFPAYRPAATAEAVFTADETELN